MSFRVKFKFMSEFGLTTSDLDNNTLPHICESSLTSGLVSELFQHAKTGHSPPVDKVALWLSIMCRIDLSTISTQSLQTKLYKLVRDKKGKGGDSLKLLNKQVFVIPVQTIAAPQSKYQKVSEAAEQSVFKELTEKLSTACEALSKKEENVLTLGKEKVSLKRQLSRATSKLEKYKSIKLQKDALEQSVHKTKEIMQETVTSKEKLCMYVRKLENNVTDLRKELTSKGLETESLEHVASVLNDFVEESSELMKTENEEVTSVIKENNDLKEANEYLQSLLNDNAELPVSTYDEDTGTFTPELTNCVMQLLNYGISSKNMANVLRDVASLCDCSLSKLPSRQTVDRMSDRRMALSQKQLESIASSENLTLYSDETSKYGRSFEVFAVSDEDKNSYVLGLREMYSKSSETVLNTLKDILHDVNKLCDQASGTEMGFQILTNIKNTMSDRAASEKKFQELLGKYREEILPKCLEGWEQMNEEEQSACAKMNNFFCGLHLLVNFADVCAEALLKFEHSVILQPGGAEALEESEEQEVKISESGTIRLLRTCSKSFAKGVDEKSGVYDPFRSYCRQKGDNVQFVRYKHNRFNVFFLLGHIAYHHRHNILHFLQSVHGCSNRLLSSVEADIKEPVYIAGCRALGIISKSVTGPLWRKMEDNSHILSLNETLSKLQDFLEIAKDDSTDVISGALRPFGKEDPEDDAIMKELYSSDDSDSFTIQILQFLFASMLTLLKRQAADHLPGGTYSTTNEELIKQTQSSLKHNKLPEFFFGQLDFLMKFRPNATTLCNESYIMFSHNKTSDWLDSLEESHRNKLIEDSRKEGTEIREKFKGRIKEIEKKRLENLRRKEEELAQKRSRILKKKEDMTRDILYYGLWQSTDNLEECLRELETKKEKLRALKVQLNFRKNVLQQTTKDKNLYLFSSGRKQKTVLELTANLRILIQESKSVALPEKRSKNKPLLIGKYIRHKFSDGQWYHGQVLSVVPGFNEWYNVKYKEDQALYVYKLHEDYAAGDLEILPETAGGWDLHICMLFRFRCYLD